MNLKSIFILFVVVRLKLFEPGNGCSVHHVVVTRLSRIATTNAAIPGWAVSALRGAVFDAFLG